MHNFIISGKTLILKERAIRSKKKHRDVVLLSLGSSSCFGIPLKTPLVYDVLTPGADLVPQSLQAGFDLV